MLVSFILKGLKMGRIAKLNEFNSLVGLFTAHGLMDKGLKDDLYSISSIIRQEPYIKIMKLTSAPFVEQLECFSKTTYTLESLTKKFGSERKGQLMLQFLGGERLDNLDAKHATNARKYAKYEETEKRKERKQVRLELLHSGKYAKD